MNIESYRWDFGDGSSSGAASPTHIYTTGWYTVSLEVLVGGVYSTIEKEYYIKVGKSNTTNFNSDYLNGKLSLHFGWDNSSSYGWSKNSGDGWIWVESKGAVFDYIYLRDKYKLAWDMYTDKQYIVSTGSGINYEEYTDKSVGRGNGEPIVSTIRLPEFNGNKQSYTLSHIETNIFLKNLDNNSDISESMEIDISLYDAKGTRPVEVQYNINKDEETVFYYQTENTESNNYRQIEISLKESGYKFVGYDSMFKVSDRSRSASGAGDTSDAILTSPISWFTRGKQKETGVAPYGFNRVNGTLSDLSSLWSPVSGPDGGSVTGGKPTIPGLDLNVHDDTIVGDKTIMLWAKTPLGDDVFDGVTLIRHDEFNVDGWYKYYYYGQIDSILKTSSGMIPIFDVRIFDTEIADNVRKYYFTNFKKLLPRY